ncbi:MAG: restriction endonuclease subunit S [Thermoplasmata archaeon]
MVHEVEESGLKETEIGLIPQDWEIARLREVATAFVGGGTPSTGKKEYWDGKIPWTTSSFISDLYIGAGQRYITKKGLQNSATKMVPRNNILIGTRVGTGKIAINTVDVAISQDLTGLIVNRQRAHVEYLAYVLLSGKVQEQIQSRNRGVTVKGIAREDLKTVSIPLPPLPEQRAIAFILSKIQHAIDQQDKIIQATRNLKKSLMQKLFTEGIGHTEFKETEIGRIPQSWDIAELSNVASEVQNGFACGKRAEDGIIQLRMDSILPDGRINPEAYVRVPVPKSVSRYLLRQDDVLFNNTNSVNLIGKTAIFRGEFGECTFSNHLTRIRVNPTKSLPDWLLYYLIRRWELRYFKSICMRHVGQAGIKKADLLSLPVPLPTIDEQQEIVHILTQVGAKTEVEERRKVVLQLLIKTFLHKLMTGEIRVKDVDLGVISVS